MTVFGTAQYVAVILLSFLHKSGQDSFASLNKSTLPLIDPLDVVPHGQYVVHRCGQSV